MVKKFVSLIIFLASLNIFSLNINELKSFVEKERGLKFKKEIELKKVSQKEAEKIIRDEIELQFKNYALKNYEEALKVFRLIPKKSNLKELIFNLLSSQVIAFYDSKSKKLYYTQDFPFDDDELFNISSYFDMSSIYLVHELVHALVDQNFDIEKTLKLTDVKNEDRQLASLSIVEGDATYIMLKFLSKSEDIKDANENILELFKEFKNIGNLMGEIAPIYLRESLLFPYLYGLNFVVKMKENNVEINSLYRNPPLSTEEIIHPQKYLKRNDTPKRCSLSSSKIEGEIIWEGTFGEYGIFLLLKSWGAREDIAKKASEGWGNDKYVVFKKKTENNPTFIWETLWDSDNDAEEFIKAIEGEKLKIKREKNLVIIEKLKEN